MSQSHSLVEQKDLVRTDVVYKAIIRDLRKFYNKDFNDVTLFMKRKRYKDQSYYFYCLRKFLAHRFPHIYKITGNEDIYSEPN